jgi:hypothetical protein
MKYNSSKNQEIKRKFVDREVIYCVSSLVSELAGKAEEFRDYEDDLYASYQSEPDYEEALTDNECEPFVDEFGAECWKDNRDGETFAGSAQYACEAFGIDAYDYCRDVFEHWIVTDWLADKLEAHGEKILRDFFGMTIWCRTTTGQAILLDGVIGEICHDMEILDGQANEWTV